MDIERLKNDPDYWNDVAPDEATHCNPDPNSDFRWYNEEKQSAMDREGGRWMDSQSSDFYWASLIPRPASKPSVMTGICFALTVFLRLAAMKNHGTPARKSDG